MFIAILPIMTAPFIIGGAMDATGISMAQAGWLGVASLVPIALTSISISPFLGRVPARPVAMSCAMCLVVGFGGLSAADRYWQYIALCMIAGVGSGGLLALIARKIAQVDNPERLYGTIYTVTSLGFAALMFALPAARGLWGVDGMFILVGILGALMIPFLLRLPDSPPVAAVAAGNSKMSGRRHAALLFIFITIAAPINGGVYAFCERKAAELALSPQLTGSILSLTMICSIIGSALVAWVGTRPGRTIPTVTVFLTAGLSYLLILSAQSVAAFIIGMALYGLIQMAMNAYLFGLASAVDRRGRVAAALQGYSLVPYAAGAGIYGSLAGSGPLMALGWPSLLINLAATALLLPMLVTLDRPQGRPSETD